jgi:hypothetical protein
LDDSTAIQTRRDDLGAPTTGSSAVAASVASLKRIRNGPPNVVPLPATWLSRRRSELVNKNSDLCGVPAPVRVAADSPRFAI